MDPEFFRGEFAENRKIEVSRDYYFAYPYEMLKIQYVYK